MSARRARVVIADDHPGVLRLATSILERTCDVVASATDGEAAINAACDLDPEIVVLDVSMPELDGFQVASRLRAAGSRAHLVFCSNYDSDDFVLAAVSRGASAFVAKPRMLVDLPEAVAHALAGRTFVPSAAVLPGWQRPPERQHDLQLYGSDAFLVENVMAFFTRALQVGDSILAVASESHLAALDGQFAARGLDAPALIAEGRYAVMNAASALDAVCRDGVPDAALWTAALDPVLERGLLASTGSSPRVSMFGEVAPILCARGELGAMTRLERIADEYVATHPISILCAYSTKCLDGVSDAAERICEEHATIVSAGRRT